jgi:hypothetical protein
MVMPQLHDMQAQKYRLRLVARSSRRTLTSAHMNQAIPKKAAAVMDCGRVGMPSLSDVPGSVSSMPLAVKLRELSVIVRKARVGQVLTDCDFSACISVQLSGACSTQGIVVAVSGDRCGKWPLPQLVLSFAAVTRRTARSHVALGSSSMRRRSEESLEDNALQGNKVLGKESGEVT